MSNTKVRDGLTADQYHVCFQQGTEPPFSGKYYNHHEDGIYHCINCDEELFDSEAKFDSGTGWPSFYEPINYDSIHETEDHSRDVIRTEVSCKKCKAHLGHVFPDGPEPTGLRYCINSLALGFTKR